MRGTAIVPPLILLAFVTLVTTNCGGQQTETSTNTERQSPEWSVESENWNVVLATPDLGVGVRRFAFVISGAEGLVRLPMLPVKIFFVENPASRVVKYEDLSTFYPFPENTRGLYSTEVEFDRAGDWQAEISVPTADGVPTTALISFQVFEEPLAVDISDPAPKSSTRTLDDVSDISELTTGSFYDAELYRLSVADALEMGVPFVTVFASPAFCTNAVCGPQVEVVSELRETYGDAVAFIHVDIYENPSELQGDLDKGIRTRALEEWGVSADEWTFVVNAEGRVSASFENFVPMRELETAILNTLERT